MTGFFPPRAVRGITEKGWTAGNCAPDFVRFTVDFEPLGAPGHEFVADLDHGHDEYEAEVHQECAPSIMHGVLLNLVGAEKNGDLPLAVDRLDGAADGLVIAVRVVLTSARYHIVDSAPLFHRHAGWRAAAAARRVLAGESATGGDG
ncbi:hypothetical protein [Allokutzneria sp. NRRL B-24872]|uniref:hypothetical protein n=1 Tax=Allokutzneria sp. NRRL B-24872 TaxID=1137961 RepID=UPI000A3D261D|nr:hypothetical protein [Allokutzneria sp. NRRL B-24872]